MVTTSTIDSDSESDLAESSVLQVDGEVTLGPFRLTRCIGKGGMGQVWRGYHERHDVPVAVKFVTTSKASDERYIRRFNNEVASVAALNHPGIVTVLDYGHIRSNASPDLVDSLSAGTPYLVMEYAEDGSLGRSSIDLSWKRVRHLLVSLLDGLAHAHARGVIHRDLKPSNILIDRSEGRGLNPKISDFGLAFILEQALSETGSQSHTGGTPQYMAPEQFRGNWRDYGAWTDLYAFGCMTWEIVCGQPPFDDGSIPDIRESHLHASLPQFTPRTNVPPDFARWLARLLEKDPAERYRRAADAKWGLLSLEDAPEEHFVQETYPVQDTESSSSVTPTTIAATRASIPPTFSPSEIDEATAAAEAGAEEGPERSIDPVPKDTPPLPEDWPQDVRPRFPTNLMGAGLELYGLREMPVVDRREERDLMWDTLSRIHRRGGTRLILLRGSAGTGKTRLARWLREYAAEIGAAVTMRGTHNPAGGPTDGLITMIARYLAATGLDRAETLARVRDWYRKRGVNEPYEWKAITELIHPGATSEEQLIKFSGDSERRAVIRRFLEHVTADRPLVIQLDDLHWSHRTLRFLEYLVSHPRQRDLPALIVGTVQNEGLAERPAEREAVEDLASEQFVQDVEVGPLTSEAQRYLIEKLLYLDPGLSHEIADRSGNNPLFAVHLVGDWVDRGLLRVGEDGFELREGADPLLPDDLYEVWSSRLDRILAGCTRDERIGLESAAALGLEVPNDEWAWVCQEIGVSVPDHLVSQLFKQNLAHRTDLGWSFVHSMLRESLERISRENGRWADLCEACADMLEVLGDELPETERSYRMAHYHLESGDDEEAASSLLEAVQARSKSGDLDATTNLLEKLETVFERLEVDEGDTRYGEYAVRRGALRVMTGDIESARSLFESALSIADETDNESIRSEAEFGLGKCAHQEGNFDEAMVRFETVQEQLDQKEAPIDYARALRARGEVHMATGNFDEARPLLRRSGSILEGKATIEAPKLAYLSGVAAAHTEHFDAAEHWFKRGLEQFEDYGSHYGMARCLNGIGEIARQRGDHEEAERYLERAARSARLVETLALADIEGSRAQLAIEKGDFETAYEIIQSVEYRLGTSWGAYNEAICVALMVCCEVALGYWNSFESSFRRLNDLLDETSVIAPDIPHALVEAARQARDRGRPQLACRLVEDAAERYSSLGLNDAAEEALDEFRI
jgi:serine/threonine protein kinase/tetratricopeptide (TPR) repeat protein